MRGGRAGPPAQVRALNPSPGPQAEECSRFRTFVIARPHTHLHLHWFCNSLFSLMHVVRSSRSGFFGVTVSVAVDLKHLSKSCRNRTCHVRHSQPLFAAAPRCSCSACCQFRCSTNVAQIASIRSLVRCDLPCDRMAIRAASALRRGGGVESVAFLAQVK